LDGKQAPAFVSVKGSTKQTGRSDDVTGMAKNLAKIDIAGDVSCNLDPSEIVIDKELGKGAFGIVYRGKLFGKHVAVKKLINQNVDAETLTTFKKEVAIMSKLRHPNVLLFMGASTEPGNLMIVTELMPRGSVHDLLHDPETTLSFKVRMKMAKQAALGMNWLHRSKPPFIHRDLKTSNLLVDDNFNVKVCNKKEGNARQKGLLTIFFLFFFFCKVCDFGLAHMKTHGNKKQGSYGATGTPLWMAPEVLMNKEYDESADLYSFGIVLWELLTGKEPFEDIDTYSTLLDRVVTGGERPEIPDGTPSKLKALIKASWDADPKRRPSFDKIIPLFDEIIVDSIIKDSEGRKLWKKYFLRKEQLEENVKWTEFVVAFCGYWKEKLPRNPDEIRFKCLHALLADNPKELVSIEAFGRMLEWFGPMKGLNILEAVENLLKKSWFHGDLSSSQAERELRKHKKGTFLVRFSAREPGCYAITTVSQSERIKHFRIYHKPGLDFLIGKSECKSLEDIIAKYHKELYLRSPCPGSPFEDLFRANKRAASVGYLVPQLD
jgi:serine/threonine protein kinase